MFRVSDHIKIRLSCQDNFTFLSRKIDRITQLAERIQPHLCPVTQCQFKLSSFRHDHPIIQYFRATFPRRNIISHSRNRIDIDTSSIHFLQFLGILIHAHNLSGCHIKYSLRLPRLYTLLNKSHFRFFIPVSESTSHGQQDNGTSDTPVKNSPKMLFPT